MKVADMSKLEEEIVESEKNNILTKNMKRIDAKKNKTIQKSYSITEYHHDYLIKKMSKIMSKTGKTTSISKVLRSIIDEDIKRNSK